MNVSVNAVVSVDASGRIVQLNPAAERTFGYGGSEAVGEPFAILLADRCRDAYRLQIDWLFSGEDAANAGRTIELVGQGRDKSEFPLELCLVTWRSASESLYTCIVRDISDRKRVASEREELLRRVEAMARTDELTGLANRRAWDEELRRELARGERTGQRPWVALLDLDRFKLYNDHNGHQAGDAFLRETAMAWRVELRVTDLLARYGGEEFAVLLTHCTLSDAIHAIKRICAATPGAETCSAGLARWDGSETAEALVCRADDALYEAKRTGRARVVRAETGEPVLRNARR